MGDLIQLSKFRNEHKRSYLKANQSRLDRFFEKFVALHFRTNYDSLSERYMALRYQQNEMAWDYHDFREDLKEAIDEAFGDVLWEEVKMLFWFDGRWLSRDEVMDRCTSFFVLGKTAAANTN